MPLGAWDIFKIAQAQERTEEADESGESTRFSSFASTASTKDSRSGYLRNIAGGSIRSTTGFGEERQVTKRNIAPFVKTPQLHRKMRHARTKKRDIPQESSIFRFTIENLDSELSYYKLPEPVYQSANILQKATASTGVAIYFVDANELFLDSGRSGDTDHQKFTWNIMPRTTVACHCAITKKFVWVEDLQNDARFPQGLGWLDNRAPNAAKYVLCAPVVTPEDEMISVFELYRTSDRLNYSRKEVQLAVSMTAWVGAGIYQNQLRLGLLRQQTLNNKLLSHINCYFSEPEMTVSKVFSDIMAYAKKILAGEKAFVYVIGSPDQIKSVEYFSESFEDADVLIKRKDNLTLDRLPGVVKHVVINKLPLHIYDIFKEPEYNDLERAEKGPNELCRSVLCAPILDNNTVIGVILLTNKRDNGYFTNMDEGTYQIFATYCSLVLHHYKVKKELVKTENYLIVDKEVLNHHWNPCHHVICKLKNARLVAPDDFFSFKWYPFDEHYAKMDEYALVIYKTLLGNNFMRKNNMVRFVAIMKKTYRSSTLYHNFEHGYTVCHGVANILIRNKQVFTGIELVGMLIGSLGHDADHRATTNSFIYLTKHPMALLYDSAILENHHFYVTNMIVKDCQLFSYLTPEVYKQVINEVEVIILHTDLAIHFRGRAKLAGILADRQFKWANPDHRYLMKGIIMTSCDLTGQSKTFRVAERLLTLLYQEFYVQGDEERKLGVSVLPMMDRDKVAQIPDDQVKFLSFVVIPCNELLYNLFPNTKEMIDNTKDLMEGWKEVVEKKRAWAPDEALTRKPNAPKTATDRQSVLMI